MIINGSLQVNQEDLEQITIESSKIKKKLKQIVFNEKIIKSKTNDISQYLFQKNNQKKQFTHFNQNQSYALDQNFQIDNKFLIPEKQNSKINLTQSQKLPKIKVISYDEFQIQKQGTQITQNENFSIITNPPKDFLDQSQATTSNKKKYYQKRLLSEKSLTLINSSLEKSFDDENNFTQKDMTLIGSFFRNHLYALTELIQQQDICNNLKMPQYQPFKIPNNILKRLKTIAKTKAKYRYRQKLNLQNNYFDIKQRIEHYQQLKKQKNKEVQSESDEEYEEEILEKSKKTVENSVVSRDINYWKKRQVNNQFQGIPMKQKVFICKGGYPYFRKALEDRGWFENPEYFSPCFDLKWTCKSVDSYYTELTKNQIVNHFKWNDSYTTKGGLSKNLKNLYCKGIDIDSYFPKSYDLFDEIEANDFFEEYKFSYAIAHMISQSIVSIPQKISPFQELKLKTAIFISQRKIFEISKQIDIILNYNFSLFVKKEEWNILTQDETFFTQQQNTNQRQIKCFLADMNHNLQLYEKYQNEESQIKDLYDLVNKTIYNLQQKDPQFFQYGSQNAWIIKPACRGIKIFQNINQIIDHILKKDNQYVIQKYLEKPLIIKERKVISLNSSIYVNLPQSLLGLHQKFGFTMNATQGFQLKNIMKIISILSKKKIQTFTFNKQFLKQKLDKHFRYSRTHVVLKTILRLFNSKNIKQQTTRENIFEEKIQPKMKKIIIQSMKSCNDHIQERQNSVELFGYDFIIDQQLNVWLLEINKSPSMMTNTVNILTKEVLRNLIPRLQEDTVKVVIDYGCDGKRRRKKKIDTGLFKCIYKQQS